MLTFQYPLDYTGAVIHVIFLNSLLFKNRTDKMFDSSFTDGERVIKEKRKLSFVHLGHT